VRATCAIQAAAAPAETVMVSSYKPSKARLQRRCDGQDTRALQHYLGHKNIQHTARYTELSPERFKSFWED
jgi:integrase